MNLRLFLWCLIGLFVVIVGCFMISICLSTADRLSSLLRETLLHGMKSYFTDMTWKRKIDSIQTQMRCCGVDSSDDWHKTYWLQRDFLVLDSPDILRYAKLDGRVTPPVVPWSCCRIDVKGPCYHDPLQLPNPEQNSTYESLNARGCLVAMKTVLDGTLCTAAVLIAFLFVLQVLVSVASRFDFTAARNAVALGDRWAASSGWLYGRLDFGLASGPNLCQIDRVSGLAGSNQSTSPDEPRASSSTDSEKLRTSGTNVRFGDEKILNRVERNAGDSCLSVGSEAIDFACIFVDTL